MPMAPTYDQLRQLSDAELVDLYDKTAESVIVGLNFILDELRRRETVRQSEAMVAMTKKVVTLTYVIAALTLINAVVAAVALAN